MIDCDVHQNFRSIAIGRLENGKPVLPK